MLECLWFWVASHRKITEAAVTRSLKVVWWRMVFEQASNVARRRNADDQGAYENALTVDIDKNNIDWEDMCCCHCLCETCFAASLRKTPGGCRWLRRITADFGLCPSAILDKSITYQSSYLWQLTLKPEKILRRQHCQRSGQRQRPCHIASHVRLVGFRCEVWLIAFQFDSTKAKWCDRCKALCPYFNFVMLSTSNFCSGQDGNLQT